MPDNRTSQLLPASFKGVSFSVRSESASGIGRKLILHEYVNSNERYVEDQGQIPPKFSIRAFVHGADFIARAARFEQALNEIGSGRLSLPTFGVLNAYAGEYTKDASQQSVGEISYTIPFFTGRPAPGPIATQTAIQDVYQAGDEARLAIEEQFSVIYPEPDTSANAVAAIGDINNIVNNIQNTVRTILPADDLGQLLRQVEVVQLNAAKLVRDASSLSTTLFAGTSQLPGIWQQISLGLSEAQAIGLGVEQLILLTNLGGGLLLSINDVNRAVAINSQFTSVPLWPETTRQRIDRNTARNAVVQANRVASLVGVYEVAAAKSYNTDDEITQTRSALEDIHERIMRIETSDYSLIQSSPNVRQAVEVARLASLNVIAQKEQEAFEIVGDEVGAPTAAFVRSYMLYAEDLTDVDGLTQRAQLLANLNTEQPSIGLNKTFKVFQV